LRAMEGNRRLKDGSIDGRGSSVIFTLTLRSIRQLQTWLEEKKLT
jgi:hypothetical protein